MRVLGGGGGGGGGEGLSRTRHEEITRMKLGKDYLNTP